MVGPSGCGKTTLLNAIAGFDTLTVGLDHARRPDASPSPDRSAPPGADRIVVFQNGALFPWRPVLWNVTCGPVMQKRMGRAEATERAARCLLASACRARTTSIRASCPADSAGAWRSCARS